MRTECYDKNKMADESNGVWSLYSSTAAATTSLLLLAASLLRLKTRNKENMMCLGENWHLIDVGAFHQLMAELHAFDFSLTSAIWIASVFYTCSFLRILIDMSASLKVLTLHCNRFSELGRFRFHESALESGVKIHVGFMLWYCQADRSGRQIVACIYFHACLSPYPHISIVAALCTTRHACRFMKVLLTTQLIILLFCKESKSTW